MISEHETIQDYLLNGIASGKFTEGAYLPSIRALAANTNVSVHAVRCAFRKLSDQGVLQSTRKRGTRILRKPAVGRALFMSSWDPHTNLLLQDEVNHALLGTHLDIEFQPYLFSEGAGFERLRQLADKDAHDTVLVTLTQERVPPAIRPDWEKFAARFRARVGFQFEDQQHLTDSVTILPDPLGAARLVADHLLKLGHRRIGVVAGKKEADGTSSERHTAALEEMLTLVGAECFPFQFSVHAGKGPAAFAKEHGCTAWWAINDFEALDHLIEFQRAGLRVPQDISLVGSNDTPWAMNAAMPLTTLSLDPPAIARAIVAAVNAVFVGKAEKKGLCRQFIRPVLVARASTVAVCGGQ
jgi:DNA-binding transcriptional regulator YhcF (GntR family)